MSLSRKNGVLKGIFTTSAASQPMMERASAHAVAGRGLEGDRYYDGTGFYSDGKEGREITLISVEALEALQSDHGVTLEPIESRRNLLTSGIDLNSLVDVRFQVGAVMLEGVRLCPPCNHLEELTRPGMLKGLVRSGGLRARIVTNGTIQTGDEITVM